MKSLALIAVLALNGAIPARAADAQGWITQAAATPETNPVVLHFRRVIDVGQVPMRFPVRVTADNRYILYVNGTRIASGPSTGDIAHWREESIDLARYLKRGRNVIAAVVWNGVKPIKLPANATPQQRQAASGAALFSQTAPSFQQSVATGFRMTGVGQAAVVSTDRRGWRVKRDSGHSFTNGWKQVKRWYYVAGMPETIDAATADFDWAGVEERGDGWRDAAPAPDAAARTVVADKLPPQIYRQTDPGHVVRTDLAGGTMFPERAVTVPANSKVKLLLQRDAMVSAYPELHVAGGAGATIRVTWAEALYDAQLKKADRNLIGDRQPVGIHDDFVADGGDRIFAPLWWRTWRYAQIEVETKEAPLILKGMSAHETGYPFTQVGRFASSDPLLASIFAIGWRTARVDAHETYMDTAYWEQKQYIGDTRLQALISYAVSGDPRLGEQAIDAFAATDIEGGLLNGTAPQRGEDAIAPFSLLWVGMLDDWRARQPDTALLRRHLARMRTVLGWFAPWQQPSGLLGKNPQWNFIDWVGQPATDRDIFPSYGKTNESCLMSALWLGALQQGAAIEQQVGDPAIGADDLNRAQRLRTAIRTRCWVQGRGLYADNPSGDRFSQHMNALAVLYDIATPQESPGLLARIFVSGKGMEAPEGLSQSSYYFDWYLAQAAVHAGEANRYVTMLDTWRDLLKQNFTTWPEEPGNTRSDTHAWSAHPTADLLGIVAGIGPDAPGYARLLVAPAPGALTHIEATAATPRGPVTVILRKAPDHVDIEVMRPASLPGRLVWLGQSYPLTGKITHLRLPGMP